MREIKVGLTKFRSIDCDFYIYPEDVYDIEGLKNYTDLETIYRVALQKLCPYRNGKISVYINAKLSTELLCVVQAAAKLNIELTVYHRDYMSGVYYPQKIYWKTNDELEVNENTELEFVLCKNRHITPVQEFIFEELPKECMFDFEWMEKEARKILSFYERKTIKVYITGLPSLFLAILNVVFDLNISIIYMHYNMDDEDYFLQIMDKNYEEN